MNRAAVAVAMMMMILRMGVETAPTDRVSAAPPSSALNLSQRLRDRVLSPRPGGEEGPAKTTTRTITTRRSKVSPNAASQDRRAQMMKMILALEELNRMFNSTLSSRITFSPRANGRNSGKKTKVPPSTEGGPRSTTGPPAAANTTVSRASADAAVPSLTGRNFRKSLPPQTKKTNKRVCFWKYCSQN